MNRGRPAVLGGQRNTEEALGESLGGINNRVRQLRIRRGNDVGGPWGGIEKYNGDFHKKNTQRKGEGVFLVNSCVKKPGVRKEDIFLPLLERSGGTRRTKGRGWDEKLSPS